MGTRADFYVNDGPEAEWLGSIAWDGYIDGIPESILTCKSEQDYRQAVADFLGGREDGTTPDMGWPWPWNTSSTTDCCYAFKAGRVLVGSWGDLYENEESMESEDAPPIGGNFPDMSARKAVTMGVRSGVLVVGV